MNEKREPAGSLFFSITDLPRKQRPFRREGNQYSLVSLSSSASEKTGPSLQTYFSPTLQRPHLPIPHFIRISSEVMMFSFEKPSSKKTGSVKRIMIGGPQITVTAFSELGATSLHTVGTNPSLPFQSASPLSTVTFRLMSSRFAHAASSSLEIRSPGVLAVTMNLLFG